MKWGILAVFLLFCLGISAQQLSSFLPEGGKVTEKNSSGKTWAMNGVYPMPLPEVLKKFDERLLAGKYQLMHKIPMTPDQSRILAAWKKGNEKLIFMFWKISDEKTGFSWGRVK